MTAKIPNVADLPDSPVANRTAEHTPAERTGATASRGRKPQKWTRTDLNFWVDTALLVIFQTLVWVAVVVHFICPPAASARGWTLWGGTLDQWMAVEFACIAALALGILIHLMLHWSWVCGVFFGRVWNRGKSGPLPDDGTRTIYGVGFMIVILNVIGLLIAATALSIQRPL